MGLTLGSAKLFATLFLFWILLNGALAPDTLVAGLLVAAALTLFFAEAPSFLSGYRLVPLSFAATGAFVVVFLRELVRANVQMARIVLSPSLPIRPGIVRVRTGLKSPVARLILANAITLTPGTLSVELKGEWLYVHWVVAKGTDPETASAAIAGAFEKHLGEMYG